MADTHLEGGICHGYAIFPWTMSSEFIFGLLECETYLRAESHLMEPESSEYNHYQVSLLLTNHDIKNHVVSVLHAHGADLAEILDCLLDVLLDDAVMLRDAHALASQHCRLKRA